MPAIYVDADACPVKSEVVRVAARYNIKVYVVSNGGIRPDPSPFVKTVIVSAGADIADDWIAERAVEHDVVVTADILLAERCVKQQAYVISPTGKLFTATNIGSIVATRNLNTHLRETGDVKSYNAGFTKTDKSNFLQKLDQIMNRVSRSGYLNV